MFQYSCLENLRPWWRSLAGHSLQCHKESDTTEVILLAYMQGFSFLSFFFLFAYGSSSRWDLSMKVMQLLGYWGPWQGQVCRDMDWFCCRSYSPIRVFFLVSCSWRSEGFFDLSFSMALPIQALRRLPCLGSFSAIQHIRHIKGSPLVGVLLCRSAC